MTPLVKAHLLSRSARLTVGLLAWRAEDEGKIKSAGSGVLISERLVLTARHVMDDFLALDPRVDAGLRPQGEFDPYYAEAILSADIHGDLSKPVEWQMDSYCRCEYSDIAVLTISPRNEKATRLVDTGLHCFDWNLRPPPIGATVQLFGYPLPDAEHGGGSLRFDGQFEVKTGHVTEVHGILQSHGYMEFPCFRIDVPVDHSFSGGPVIWNGRLAGIVSGGPSFDDATWAASLWPALTMKYSEADVEGDLGYLFDAGKLSATDWQDVRGHVQTLPACATDGCIRTHLELTI